MDDLRAELAEVGADEFCRRRVEEFPGLMPDRMIADLRRAPLRDVRCVSWEPKLTPQRLAVLRGLSRGLLDKQIAGELGVSVNTVKTQLKAVYSVLGASNRAHAVHLAHELGVL